MADERCRRSPEIVDTVIFVDVDGVLNVGIRDGNKPALALNGSNLAQARRMLGAGAKDPLVEKIVDVCGRPTSPNGGEETYHTLVASSTSDVSDVLVGRLAALIQAAGDGCKMVLSSTWRLPHHLKRKVRLEALISRQLGEKFTFDGATDPTRDNVAEMRLKLLGDAIADLCSQPRGVSRRLRILVLEDFFIGLPGTWMWEGAVVESMEVVETYLRSRAPADMDLDIKVVHTVASWTTKSGLDVQVGAGLTQDKFKSAMAFLDGSRMDSISCVGPPLASRTPSLPVPEKTADKAKAATKVGHRWLSQLGATFLRPAFPASAIGL